MFWEGAEDGVHRALSWGRGREGIKGFGGGSYIFFITYTAKRAGEATDPW
jgi:hypothetical protein